MTKSYGNKITAQAWWETRESCQSLKERVKVAKPEAGGLLSMSDLECLGILSAQNTLDLDM